MNKKDKLDVDYSRGKATSKCAICEHFEAPNRCAKVAGSIDPNYWCELFARGSKYEAMTRRTNVAPDNDYKLMSRKRRMVGAPKPPGTF